MKVAELLMGALIEAPLAGYRGFVGFVRYLRGIKPPLRTCKLYPDNPREGLRPEAINT